MTVTDEPQVTPQDPDAAGAADASGKKGKKAKKAKGGRSNLVPALVLAAGIAAGGWFMGSGGSAAPAGGDPAVVEEAEPELEPGATVSMESMSLNLAEGHYLRIGVAVQVADGVDAEEFETYEMPKVRDLVIATAGGRQMDELATAAGREALKSELLHGAQEMLPEEVYDLYLTELVMQ